MSLTIYVGRDIQDETQLPGTHHESRDVRALCRYLAQTWFHDHSRHYALIAGPLRTGTFREIAPDLVIVSQLGVGIMELKNYRGRMDCSQKNGPWTADDAVIDAGSAANPLRQVLAYAAAIKQDLIADMRLPGDLSDWDEMKLQTAVCFTHPYADVIDCERQVQQYPLDKTMKKVGGPFSVITPRQTLAWAEDLRFGVSMGMMYQNRPLQWTPQQVQHVAADFFGAREWESLNRWAESAAKRPYGYCTLLDDREPAPVAPLRRVQATVGRESTNDVIISPTYGGVGRVHARFTYAWLDAVVIEPLSPAYGVWVNGQRTQKRELADGDEIVLGPADAPQTGCRLRFTLTQPPAAPTETARR